MRRILAIVLSVMMLVGLCACNQAATTAETQAASQSTAAAQSGDAKDMQFSG